MPRARISAAGIAIAKPGYDVDTASLANMAFSPQFSAYRVFTTGAVFCAPFTEFYNRGLVNYGKTFPAPPFVFVAGVNSDNRDITANVYKEIPFPDGTAYVLPYYVIIARTNGFELL